MTDEQTQATSSSAPTVEAPRSPHSNGGSVAIDVRGVSKAFGGTKALSDVSFSIQHGRIHALLGGNGSGKSTLIKIMAGVYQADEGEIEVNGNAHSAATTSPDWARDVGLHFVHQGVGVFPDLSVAENFALGSSYERVNFGQIPWRSLNRRAEEILQRFEVNVSPKARMGDLRPALQTMVAICRALQDRDDEEAARDVLVLDEPTVALPADEVELLLDALRQHAARGQTVILVTHRLDEVLAVASDATFLRDGRHLETRAVTGMRREELVQRIAGIEHPAPDTEANAGLNRTERLRIEHLATGPLQDVNLLASGGDIIGIAGLLGSGRSSLLRSLFGIHAWRAGTVTLDGEDIKLKVPADAMSKGIVYLPENRDTEASFADQPVRLNFSISHVGSYWKLWRLSRRGERNAARQAVKDFSISAASVEAGFSSLSGGNQQKVVLARWMHLKPRLLLLDEPTQGVDVGARSMIHSLIRKAAADGAVVLVVSSDARELVELCNRVVGLHRGAVAGELTDAAIETRSCLELAYGAGASDEAEAA
jgi:ribose transport system ATP-binding protein